MMDEIENYVSDIADLERARIILDYAGVMDKKMTENGIPLPKHWEYLVSARKPPCFSGSLPWTPMTL